jgi:hypothetical protein
LDIRKQTIKVVFAGSSESSLRRMFGRATEPFYNWAPIEPFEQKHELVVKLEYGHYQIQDEGFVEWLRQLELEE